MNKNVIIVDSDLVSAFILKRSLELLVPEQRFTTKVVGSLKDFYTDLRSLSGRTTLQTVHWIVIDTKYIWDERVTLMDVLNFVRAYAPNLKLVVTTEYFSENLFHSILSQNLVDEIVVKPFSRDSLRSLVNSCY